MTMKTSSIFVYGTLTSPEVVRILLGRELAAIRPARLAGYSRHPVKEFVFPGMIPCVGKSVEGCIYTDVSPLERKMLDWFEGDEYLRQTVQATVDDDSSESSSSTTVETYVWNPHLVDQLLQDQEWSYENFRQLHLEWYLKHTVQPCRDEMEKLGINK
jgi:gamma-glutamylcyclotransferase (GGCT)/AIG2-like uncharacterized protein YtfP